MSTENKVKWLARFFKVIIEKYIDWKIVTMEEDGGAWDHVSHAGKKFEDAVDTAWKYRRMEERVRGVLVHRDVNYRDESDADLGIQSVKEVA